MSDDERDIRALLAAEAERAPRPQGLRSATVRSGRGRRVGAVALPLLVVVSVAWVAVAQPFASDTRPKVVGPAPASTQGRIAFTRWGQDRGIMTMNADGSDVKTVVASVNKPLDNPAWSSDGTRIAFHIPGDTSSERGVVVTARAGEFETDLDPVGIGDMPTWSPDGERIALTRGGTILISSLDGNEQHSSIDVEGEFPDWSPDGERIAYSSGLNLFLVPVAGGEPTKIPNPSWADVPTHAQWSPDGTEIAVTVYTDEIVNGVNESYIGIVDVESGAMRHLIDGRSPTWSPDGEKIAFERADGPNTSHIFSVSVDGTDERQLTFGEVADHSPDWGPDRITPTSDEQACLQWAAEVTAEAQVRALRWTGTSQEVKRATVGWERMLKSASWFLDRDGNRVVRPDGCIPDKGVFLLKAQLGDVSVDATLEVDAHGRSVCVNGKVNGARAAHLHFDDPSKSDPVIVTLFEPPNNFAQQCVIDALSTSEAQQVLDRPSEYFVDFHPDETSLPLEIPLTQNGSRDNPSLDDGQANCNDPKGDLLGEGSGDQSGPGPQPPDEDHAGTDLTGFSMSRSSDGTLEMNFGTRGPIPESLQSGAQLHFLLFAKPKPSSNRVAAIRVSLEGGSWTVWARNDDDESQVGLAPHIAGNVVNLVVAPELVPSLMRGDFHWGARSEWMPEPTTSASEIYTDYCPDEGRFPRFEGHST